MAMATMETWRNGPMGFEWEHLTPAQTDAMHDLKLHQHATKWHEQLNRKESKDVSG